MFDHFCPLNFFLYYGNRVNFVKFMAGRERFEKSILTT
nr:MAG TPA: hypothetical protein [Caudoviricetes sp.]